MSKNVKCDNPSFLQLQHFFQNHPYQILILSRDQWSPKESTLALSDPKWYSNTSEGQWSQFTNLNLDFYNINISIFKMTEMTPTFVTFASFAHPWLMTWYGEYKKVFFLRSWTTFFIAIIFWMWTWLENCGRRRKKSIFMFQKKSFPTLPNLSKKGNVSAITMNKMVSSKWTLKIR